MINSPLDVISLWKRGMAWVNKSRSERVFTSHDFLPPSPLVQRHACPQPVSGGIVYIKYCVCKIRHLVLCTMTITDGRKYLLNIFCMSTETDRLSTGMVTSDQWAKVYIGVLTCVWADIHLVSSVFLVYFECYLSVSVILTNMWPVAGGEIKKL